MALLVQFLLRLTFGLALGMAITSPKLVSSGYFRNHLYVTLGLASLAALLSNSLSPEVLWLAAVAAALSYVGSVCWLYEKPAAGKLMLFLVFSASFLGTLRLLPTTNERNIQSPNYSKDVSGRASDERLLSDSTGGTRFQLRSPAMLEAADLHSGLSNLSSGLLLGTTMAAMLLGHWYLNSPGMELAPLRKLISKMALAVGLQAVLSAIGLWGQLTYGPSPTTQWILFLFLRWTFGIVGVAAMAWMAWQTLKIPNTQSATGILYVAVIGTFVGETMALLLSSESLFPL